MKQREILLLSISVFIVIACWIGFSIFHNLNVSKIPESTVEKIKPISPDFDQTTIENIKKKAYIDPLLEKEVASESSSIENIDEAAIIFDELETLIENSTQSAIDTNFQ